MHQVDESVYNLITRISNTDSLQAMTETQTLYAVQSEDVVEYWIVENEGGLDELIRYYQAEEPWVPCTKSCFFPFRPVRG